MLILKTPALVYQTLKPNHLQLLPRLWKSHMSSPGCPPLSFFVVHKAPWFGFTPQIHPPAWGLSRAQLSCHCHSERAAGGTNPPSLGTMLVAQVTCCTQPWLVGKSILDLAVPPNKDWWGTVPTHTGSEMAQELNPLPELSSAGNNVVVNNKGL